ncbi:putative oxidoreductase [Bradyrhizobium diazoefficiens]|uniref:Putative oxidoreductase n=1 Tax=Bradyrhizobium diazoefficiens TaxID=1355477 RepID=A0A0E3VWU8_9BRAD|nr:putative oxidoreductase [Bradyrhizobium diazoefficiens]
MLNLARRGVDVMFTYHSAVAEAEMVTREVEQMGRRARALQLDVGRTSTFETFVSQVREALGEIGAIRFDYLVNNAGISHHNSLEKTTEAELDDIYRVNFKGVFFLTQKLLPLMSDGGRIVNLSSGLARIIIPGSGPYGALKAAIDVLTRYQAKEFASRGIAVNAVAPGAVQTDFSGGMVRDNPELNKQVAGMTALGRAGAPDDIGPMIASLLSDDNRWVNAQRIEVSGAWRFSLPGGADGRSDRLLLRSSPAMQYLPAGNRCLRAPPGFPWEPAWPMTLQRKIPPK